LGREGRGDRLGVNIGKGDEERNIVKEGMGCWGRIRG
jgi:hypothetical protein